MTTDRTGAPTLVTAGSDRFSIAVNGKTVGFADFFDRDGARVFPHTEVDQAYQGRGLATILVREALEATREAGLQVVPQCWMVAEFIDKNPEFAGLLQRKA
ncbi:GNAT family N-acetyltransferase [Mycolicibacterium duvalii]|uniref:N-acetyltransferase n=1 Tax=Mycolicibacterium duvalii TaxID=39688 RepID=A0A7I7K709_9MYCO|nr:GNAT family N-acetyltransferase [Mycolicibacterium duvalii]MCV7370692.1 N-acetyltransferase [Mycolicibacterium duvalii]PEG36084.1 GNAT family N-acetyltransferase [Mycolicibacterium duvalii]BBX19354.1 N-acetyltransferase [Mycolicibacterium duvalii]